MKRKSAVAMVTIVYVDKIQEYELEFDLTKYTGQLVYQLIVIYCSIIIKLQVCQ